MASFADRVKVTVDGSTSGTGAVTLSTAVSGYQAVPSALDGASIRYVIELGTAWEIGLGVYTHSSLNLTRSLTSSSTGSLLSLNNTAVVFISPAAEDLQYVEVYSSTSDLPAASSNHGRIAHVHGDGAMYFAHSGNWVRLGNHSDITSYSNATTSADGLMSSSDKTKLDGVATSANNYSLPTASASTLGGIKIGTGLSIDGSGVVTASGSSSSGGSLEPITTTKTTATAGQTVFTGTWKSENISVFLNGVKLQDSEVTATDTQITISAAAVGDIVEVVEYGAPFASPYASTFPTVTTGATSVTVDYTPDKVAVYKNGVKLRGGGVDFTASNGTSITGFSAFVANDVVEVVEHGSLAESGGGVTTYDNYSDLPSSSNTDGDLGWVKDLSGSGATKALYVWDGSAWDRVYSDSQEGPVFTTSPNASYALSGGNNTDVTVAASDPEGFPITYSVVVNPTNQAQATITQPSTGTFRFAASSSTSNGGSFTAKFVADDGIYRAIASSSFSLTFGTNITTPSGYPFASSAGTNTFDLPVVHDTQTANAGFSSTLRTGKIYIELVMGSNTSDRGMIGLCPNEITSAGWNTANTFSLYSIFGSKYPGAVDINLEPFNDTGDIVMFAYDTSTREVWAGVNGTWYQDPSTTSSSYTIGTSSTTAFKLMFGAANNSQNYNGTIITGNGTLNYTLPTDFEAH